MKYILKEKIPFTNYGVGHVFETDIDSCIVYEVRVSGGLFAIRPESIEPHEILLMVKAGILEEVDERFPKVDFVYWYVSDIGTICHDVFLDEEEDKFRFKTGNCFRSEEEAKAHYDKIMNS